MSVLDGIFQQEESIDMKQKIVEELLNTDKNLETKTELSKPMKWSCLNLIEEYVVDHKLPKAAKILHNFRETSFKYLISNGRAGRKEYIEALKSLANLDDNEKPSLMSLMKGG